LAAVQGERFDFDLLCATSGEEPSGLLAALRVLVQRRFLDESEQDYRFHHDKIRQVAYESIEAAHRPRLHRRVAEALGSHQPTRVAALAHHWTEAEMWDKAAAYHHQAGDRAAEVYANAEAVEHYTQALAALDRLPGTADPGARYDILLAREAIHDLQGEREAQAEDLKALEALVQAGEHAMQEAWLAIEEDPHSPPLARRRVQVALRRAQYTMAMVDYAAAVAMIQEAVSLAKAARITELEAEGYYHWGSALWRLGQWEQARQKLDELLEMARREGLHDLEAKALGLLTHLAVEQGEYAQARLLGKQALNLFRKRKDRRGESGAHRSIGLAAAWAGDYVAAESHQKQSLGLAREIGYLSGQGMALSGLGIIAAEQGYYVEARSYYDQALRIFGRTGDRDHEGRILNNLGFILDQMGAYAEAEDHFERVLANSRDIGSRHGEVVALVNLAQVANHQGRNQEALELGQQALAHAEEIGERRAQGYAWTIVGDILASLGRLADAESAYRRSLGLRRELGQPNLAPEALAGLVRLALARRDLRQAFAFTDEILEHLKMGSLGGTKDPMLVYLSCYQALQAVHDARAPRILAEAYHQVQEQAARITDDRLRRRYLDNVDAHREIVAAHAAWQSRSLKAVRLPCADAPTGRPLRDDEYVTVTWTVAAPEDEALEDGPARRQARIHRLLQEAAEQGATPTVGDLAAALAVSEPTVRRDLAALRHAGHPVKTRGSRGG
jgi:tetratricopeptide (TPR) repeat protein